MQQYSIQSLDLQNLQLRDKIDTIQTLAFEEKALLLVTRYKLPLMDMLSKNGNFLIQTIWRYNISSATLHRTPNRSSCKKTRRN